MTNYIDDLDSEVHPDHDVPVTDHGGSHIPLQDISSETFHLKNDSAEDLHSDQIPNFTPHIQHEGDFPELSPSDFHEDILSDCAEINIFDQNHLPWIHEQPEHIEDPLGTVYGQPDKDQDYWHIQSSPDTCAVVTQEYVIEGIVGHDIDEDALVNEAAEKGYYIPGKGTDLWDVGDLIEDYGIPVEKTFDNTIDDVKECLENNRKVIVALDANEIWYPSDFHQLMDCFFMPEANHAVQVIGYDDYNGKVILNDPGTSNGKGLEVPVDRFLEAWEDSNNFMVVTAPSPHVSA